MIGPGVHGSDNKKMFGTPLGLTKKLLGHLLPIHRPVCDKNLNPLCPTSLQSALGQCRHVEPRGKVRSVSKVLSYGRKVF